MLSDTTQAAPSNQIPVPINPTRCRSKGPFSLCNHEVPEIANKSLCLESVLSGRKTNQCTIKFISHYTEKVVHATRAAVLVRGFTEVKLTQIIKGIPMTMSQQLTTKALTTLSYTNFSVLSIDGHTIISPLSHRGQMVSTHTLMDLPGVIALNFSEHHLYSDSSLEDAESGSIHFWGQRGHLVSTLDKINLSHNMAVGSVATIVLTIICVSCMVGYCVYKYKKQITSYKRKSVAAVQSVLLRMPTHTTKPSPQEEEEL